MTTVKLKHLLAVRWFHWINFPVLFVMIWSGLLIYWANDVYRVGWGRWTLFHFFPESFYRSLQIGGRLAEGLAWHFVFMWLFGINGVLYVLYTACSGEWRYLLPNRNTLREAFRVLSPGGRFGVSDVVAEDRLTPAERAERGSYAGCVAGALSRSEYLDGLAAAGFVDATVEFTQEAADGMHNAVIRARKPV